MAPAATNEFIDQVHNQNHPFWEQLASVMPGTQDAVGAAAGHQANYRHEGAYKLILNHEAVLRDICNPSPMQNVIGVELTQKDLKRVPAQYAHHVDQFLRELTRRLMGRVAVPEEKAQPMSEQSVAWTQAALFLTARLHTGQAEKPGRVPDMDSGAALAMRSVIQELGREGWGL